MNLVRTATSILLLGLLASACTSAAVEADEPRSPARRTYGGFFKAFTREGKNYVLYQVTKNRIEWAGTSLRVQATMPFDLAGDCINVGVDRFVISGRDSATDTNYLICIELTTSPFPDIRVVQTSDTGLVDAGSLAFNATESRLYLYDGMQRLVSSAAWTPWSPLPNVWSNHDLSGLRFVPSMITKPYVGEGSRGVYLRFRAAVAHGFDPNRKVHVYLDNGTWRVIELYSPPFGS